MCRAFLRYHTRTAMPLKTHRYERPLPAREGTDLWYRGVGGIIPAPVPIVEFVLPRMAYSQVMKSIFVYIKRRDRCLVIISGRASVRRSFDLNTLILPALIHTRIAQPRYPGPTLLPSFCTSLLQSPMPSFCTSCLYYCVVLFPSFNIA